MVVEGKAALPTVPTSAHPTQPELGLLYVGIAPNAATSGATIRSRILSDHLGKAIGSSTLRRALTALLWGLEGWHVFIKAKKPAIRPDEYTALPRWMARHLLVSWSGAAEPWVYEPTLIAEMRPPLNSDRKHDHSFYPTLCQARNTS